MPCSAAARGVAAGARPPFNDATDNNPCGKKIVTSAKGVDVTAHSLCLPHLAAKLGLDAIRSPMVIEP